ncbi:hypothetical protein ACSBR2_009405 [Camellia fascicularis]
MELMKIGSFCNLLQLCKHLSNFYINGSLLFPSKRLINLQVIAFNLEEEMKETERTKESTREENDYPRQPNLPLRRLINLRVIAFNLEEEMKETGLAITANKAQLLSATTTIPRPI